MVETIKKRLEAKNDGLAKARPIGNKGLLERLGTKDQEVVAEMVDNTFESAYEGGQNKRLDYTTIGHSWEVHQGEGVAVILDDLDESTYTIAHAVPKQNTGFQEKKCAELDVGKRELGQGRDVIEQAWEHARYGDLRSKKFGSMNGQRVDRDAPDYEVGTCSSFPRAAAEYALDRTAQAGRDMISLLI